MGLDIYFIPIGLMMIVIILLLINISNGLSRHNRHNKEIEDAIYRLIEITKENNKS